VTWARTERVNLYLQSTSKGSTKKEKNMCYIFGPQAPFRTVGPW